MSTIGPISLIIGRTQKQLVVSAVWFLTSWSSCCHSHCLFMTFTLLTALMHSEDNAQRPPDLLLPPEELAALCCSPYEQSRGEVSGSGSSPFTQRAGKTLNKPLHRRAMAEAEPSLA